MFFFSLFFALFETGADIFSDYFPEKQTCFKPQLPHSISIYLSGSNSIVRVYVFTSTPLHSASRV